MVNTLHQQPVRGSKKRVFWIVFVIYQFLWHLIVPFVIFRLWLRGRLEPGYRQHILERFGFYSPFSDFKSDIWVHAVSMGETRAAVPLIEQLLASGKKVLLSHMTASGRSTSEQIFANAIAHGRLRQVYIPYDFCWPVMRFLRHFQPPKGLLIETELWPGLLVYAQKCGVPMYLINGRLSEKSFKKFIKWGSVSQSMCQMLSGVAAQTESDAKNFTALGIENILITGNLKFDVNLSNELILKGETWKKMRWPDRQVIMAASTREGEEKIIIQAIKALNFSPKPLLLLVPRHLKRLPEIEDYIQQQNLRIMKRSEFTEQNTEQESPITNIDILIGDTFGEMAAYYASCDLVVMGGTLQGTGGQNLIEPCALGKPVILGPSTFNFSLVSQNAIECGAAVALKNSSDQSNQNQLTMTLVKELEDLLSQPKKMQEMGERGFAFTHHHQGATRKTLKFLEAN